MKVYKLYYLLLLCGILCISQNSKAQTMTVSEMLTQVYSSYATSFTTEQIDWATNCKERCTILTLTLSALDTIPALSTIPINNKINDSLTADNTYDAITFNPLKYQINFKLDYDQYFRFGSTNTILKVAKED